MKSFCVCGGRVFKKNFFIHFSCLFSTDDVLVLTGIIFFTFTVFWQNLFGPYLNIMADWALKNNLKSTEAVTVGMQKREWTVAAVYCCLQTSADEQIYTDCLDQLSKSQALHRKVSQQLPERCRRSHLLLYSCEGNLPAKCSSSALPWGWGCCPREITWRTTELTIKTRYKFTIKDFFF